MFFFRIWREKHNVCEIVVHSFVWIMLFGRIVDYWNWRWILKWLFCFLLDLKIKWIALQVFWWNHSTFCKPWRCPKKIHFTSTLKKHNNKNLSIFNTNFNIQRPVQITWSTPLSRSFCIFHRCNFHLHQLLWRTMVDYVQLECNDNMFFLNLSFRMWRGKHRACEIVDHAFHQCFYSLEKTIIRDFRLVLSWRCRKIAWVLPMRGSQ